MYFLDANLTRQRHTVSLSVCVYSSSVRLVFPVGDRFWHSRAYSLFKDHWLLCVPLAI